jgi:flagellar assembly protein FliH
LSNKIYKNHQVSLGMPFQVKSLFNYQNIRTIEAINQNDDEVSENNIEISESKEQILEKAKNEAELIIQEAQYEANRILENTQAEAEENKNKIFVEAHQNGYDEGYNQAKQEYEDLINEAELIRETAKAEYKETLDSIENDAINLILDIAKNVIGTEISFHKEDILYLVQQAFEKCTNKETVLLKAASEDYDFIIANKVKLLSMLEGVGELKIKKDNSLKVGSCVIETPYGSIDAGIHTKMKKIEELFKQLVGKQN